MVFGKGILINYIFGNGFMLAFVYILLFVFAKSIAEAKTISNAALAVWTPNVLFIIIGLVLYRKVPR